MVGTIAISAIFDEAERHLRRGEDAAAAPLLRGLLANWTGARDPASRRDRFRTLVAMRRYSQAFVEAEALLRSDATPETLGILRCPWQGSGVFTRPELRFRRDIAVLGRLTLIADRPWPWFYRGVLQAKLARPAGRADLETAARFRAARYRWMRRELGLLRLHDNDARGAIPPLLAAVQSSRPPDWLAQAYLADAYLGSRRPSEALQAIRLARDFIPPGEIGEALAWEGDLLLRMGRPKAALRVLDRAESAGGKHALGWRGRAWLMLGRWDRALMDLDGALRRNPTDREAWLWRAQAKERLGDRRGALQDVARLQTFPSRDMSNQIDELRDRLTPRRRRQIRADPAPHPPGAAGSKSAGANARARSR